MATADASEHVLVTRALSKAYGGAVALDAFDFHVDRGEVVALVGHNGAGKSTASKILAGFVHPDRGTVSVEGRELEAWSPRHAQRSGVVLVPQQFSIVPELSVEENISLGYPAARSEIIRAADALGLREHLATPAEDVSPAIHRLTMIGRGLVRNPKIMILDEPTAAFSGAETQRLFEIVNSLRKEGIGFIYISHRLQEVLDISDRVVGMSAGKKICDLESHTLTKESLADVISGNHTTLVGGHTGDQLRHSVKVREASPVLEVSELTSQRKLREVSMTVHQGEVLGITGLIGAGRSTLLNTIWGMYGPPDGGSLKIAGEEYVPKSPRLAVSKSVALVPEGRMRNSVIPDLNVTENVTLSTLRAERGLQSPLLSKRREQEDVRKVLSRLQTKPENAFEMQIGELSGGNQQKVVISRWLMRAARLYMFDEPTEGVDIGARREIYASLREIAGQGAAVIISTSDVEEVVEYADRVLVMKDGRIVEEVPQEFQNVEYVSRACL